MKTKILLLLIVIPPLLISCTVMENVGSIKQSLLTPETFKITQKGVWVLLDGSEVDQKSSLFTILKNNAQLNILTKKGDKYYLPNALGAFIRSSNYSGKGVDTDANRLAGSFQDDMLKAHSHKFEGAARNDVSGRGSNSKYAWNPATYSTEPEGGAETRPKNISMYTYIKVDK
ncbi:hypothetical protein FMM05_16935 [Flavobacterium zepuense]|uniref:Uncharacterized protein n=1 Tax=Flavobacterium zepuense TaxID=2593302 RepID=A0A552UWJ6_9FLAO|nr:hypothetical protein [Flavobacterium zepuense]TRW22565.1 hypothetical protein FMM05_16935 [Flavobacterium zepuense]